MSIHGPAFDRAERAYLSPPEDRFPPGVEDVMDMIVMWPEGPDEETLVPEFGKVTDFGEDEPDCEADEDGRACWSGGGVRVEITQLFVEAKNTTWMTLGELDDLAVPEALKPIVEAHEKAERLAREAQGQRNVAANRRAQAGREAVQARKEQS